MKDRHKTPIFKQIAYLLLPGFIVVLVEEFLFKNEVHIFYVKANENKIEDWVNK